MAKLPKNPPPPIETPAAPATVQPELPIVVGAPVQPERDRTYAARAGRLASRIIRERNSEEGDGAPTDSANPRPGWEKQRDALKAQFSSGLVADGSRRMNKIEQLDVLGQIHKLDAKLARPRGGSVEIFSDGDYAWALANKVASGSNFFDDYRLTGIPESIVVAAEALTPEQIEAHGEALANRKAV